MLHSRGDDDTQHQRVMKLPVFDDGLMVIDTHDTAKALASTTEQVTNFHSAIFAKKEGRGK